MATLGYLGLFGLRPHKPPGITVGHLRPPTSTFGYSEVTKPIVITLGHLGSYEVTKPIVITLGHLEPP